MKQFFVATALIAFSASPLGGEVTFCALTLQVAAAGKLTEYSNKQIENGLCMTTKEVLNAVMGDDDSKQEVCMQASQYMMQEFKSRFPGRDVKSVAGKC